MQHFPFDGINIFALSTTVAKILRAEKNDLDLDL